MLWLTTNREALMRSNLIYVIFATVLLMAGILVAICLADTVPNAAGVAHEQFNGMQAGGDGAARLEHIGGLAFAFQALLLVLIVCLAALGIAEERRSPELWAYMGGTLLFSLFVWWQMYSGHQAFLETGVTRYFMGFPVATAWQVYGTWLGAIPLIVLYSVGFRKFVFTVEDERKYEQLLEKIAEKSEQ
ncbi:MAG: hypothetical protein COB20_03450 [SAR86 cluster bacterium]|uniref:Uncharacterized protein n=1 Tax=SAR86 cluster bacterium TaxID=2030880 RepID=A0A2A4XC69_9GAMM|nr:MAG: hypothetical protein COB20_03450 [SAR86 cluster bacterium]